MAGVSGGAGISQTNNGLAVPYHWFVHTHTDTKTDKYTDTHTKTDKYADTDTDVYSTVRLRMDQVVR